MEKLKDKLTAPDIVKELDKYIIGQQTAKKAVAIALRNRTRRKNVVGDLRDEISPKNIIMIGATGIGKTEIARRLANLTGAPFIKVEATKFTEVGYVGRDVESIVRDLVNKSINEEKKASESLVKEEATKLTEEKILDSLLPRRESSSMGSSNASISLSNNLSSNEGDGVNEKEVEKTMVKTREKFRQKLKNKDFEDKYIDIEINATRNKNAFIEFSPEKGFEQIDSMMQNILGQLGGGNKNKKLKIKDARNILQANFCEKLIDMDKVIQTALEKTESTGIVFLDEIDKIAAKESSRGPDVSREGVQRDILPLVEGCNVNTKYGVVKTDHILFIASGAFHMSSPSDLIPELQGRFPIRVELESLGVKDLEKILTKPKNALIKQYQALLSSEGVDLTFDNSAISEIARIASEVNRITYNIGARRLATVMEKLLEDLLFNAPNVDKTISITGDYVKKKLKGIEKDKDLSKYIL